MVWKRTTSGRTVYYACATYRGRQVRHLVGPDKREAERVERALKKAIVEGAYSPEWSFRRRVRLDTFAVRWAEGLTNRSARVDRQMLEDWILPELGGRYLDEIDGPTVARWLEWLRAQAPRRGGRGERLSASTVRSIHSVLVRVQKAAKFEGLVSSVTASDLPRGMLPTRGRRKLPPGRRENAERLIMCETIAPERRIFYSLTYLAGLRPGEAAGRRWRDLDSQASPLWCLHVHSQYQDEPLKTADGEYTADRWVPVHHELQRILEEWRSSGWARVYGRHPSRGDFIIPDPREPSRALTKAQITHWPPHDCKRAGIEPQGAHAGRRWFASYVRMDGGRADILERITHNSAGTQLDQYTYFGWDVMCETVACLRVILRPDAEVVPFRTEVSHA